MCKLEKVWPLNFGAICSFAISHTDLLIGNNYNIMYSITGYIVAIKFFVFR